MKNLKGEVACFFTFLILLQSCSFYHEPKMSLKKATKKQVKSKVFFEDSVKTYDYIVKSNGNYYGQTYSYVDQYNPKLRSDNLTKENIIAIRGMKEKDRTLSTIINIVTIGGFTTLLIASPDFREGFLYGFIRALFGIEDDDY